MLLHPWIVVLSVIRALSEASWILYQQERPVPAIVKLSEIPVWEVFVPLGWDNETLVATVGEEIIGE